MNDDERLYEDDWELVRIAVHSILAASLADDPESRRSAFVELQRVLTRLRGSYGDHPVLCETEADFEEDSNRRINLYRLALEQAARRQFSTLTIRLSLARVLIEECHDSSNALTELDSCRHEMKTFGDSDASREWYELYSICLETKGE